MDAIASEITSLTIVYSIVYSDADQRKHQTFRVTGLCAGNSPRTGEFAAQMASYAENVSIWWRHHVVTRQSTLWGRDKLVPSRRRYFQIHFREWNFFILIRISLKFVPRAPINNIPALIGSAWPASSHCHIRLWLVYWRIYASLGLNELKSLHLTWSSCASKFLSIFKWIVLTLEYNGGVPVV